MHRQGASLALEYRQIRPVRLRLSTAAQLWSSGRS